MTYEFETCRLSGEGNTIFPDEIIIDDEEAVVIHRKPKLIGCRETKMHIDYLPPKSRPAALYGKRPFTDDGLFFQIEGKLVNLVDLGLPSGTLWADMNIGATSIEQRGNHYAWGEIEPKDNYTWETYKFGTENALTKYCTQEWYGTVDNLNTLEACDDIATVMYGKTMHIPSIEQWFELYDNCTIEWTYINEWGGYKITGKNENSIFLPVTGIMIGTEIDRPEAYGSGDYWSSALCDNNNTAWDLDFDWGGFYLDDSSMNLRWHGKAIRACTK